MRRGLIRVAAWLLVAMLIPATVAVAQATLTTRWVIVQFQPERDQQRNIDSIDMAIELAGSIGADLVLLPELATTMYPWGIGSDVTDYYSTAAERVPEGPTCSRFAAQAARYEMYVGWGMAEADGSGGIYNSFVMIGPDGSHVGTYRKIHLVPGIETAIFRAGSQVELLPTSLGKIGVLICFDRRFPELARSYTLQGADILVVPSATSDRAVDEFLLPARAYENDLWLLFANQVGPHPQPRTDPMHGDSRVIDPLGETRARASGDQVELLVIDVSLEDVAMSTGILNWRRPDVYGQAAAITEEEGAVPEEAIEGPHAGTGGGTLDDALASARQIVSEAIAAGSVPGEESPVLYVLPQPLAAGERIESWTGIVFEATGDTWFVFVDLEPSANWEHPSRYLFVDVATGETTITAATVPPINLSEMIIAGEGEAGG